MIKFYSETRADGTVYHYKEVDGEKMLHHENGPAVLYPDGSTKWFVDDKLHRVGAPCMDTPECEGWAIMGKRHRVGGPAVIKRVVTNTLSAWFVHDKLHRLDGPAIYDDEGRKEWYVNNKRHRVDEPAIITPQGDKYWYQRGKRHRLDGPATELFRPARYAGTGNQGGGKTYGYFVNGVRASNTNEYEKLVARWFSYREVTRNDIQSLIGNFRIVEWE